VPTAFGSRSYEPPDLQRKQCSGASYVPTSLRNSGIPALRNSTSLYLSSLTPRGWRLLGYAASRRACALLHDVGKLLTPDEVLIKPGSLTHEERAVVERHPADGAALLAPFPHLGEAAKIVRAHHERPRRHRVPGRTDRGGHSRGRVDVSVVDAWDAMVSDRPYRDGMPAERAAPILREGAGTQWCGAAVELVLTEIRVGGVAQPGGLDRVGRVALARAGQPQVDPLSACLPGLAPVPVSGELGA